MDTLRIDAVYENGALKLSNALPLQPGQKVTVFVQLPEGAGGSRHAVMEWKGKQEDLDYLLSPDNSSPARDPE